MIRYDIQGNSTSNGVKQILQNIASGAISGDEIKQIITFKDDVEKKNEKAYKKLNNALHHKGDNAFQKQAKRYKDDVDVYDEDNGIQDRGGYMRMSLFDLLRWHIPDYQERFELLARLVEYNLWGFVYHQENVGKSGFDINAEGGTNTPIAFHSQILLAILICNIYLEYGFSGIIMVFLIILHLFIFVKFIDTDYSFCS